MLCAKTSKHIHTTIYVCRKNADPDHAPANSATVSVMGKNQARKWEERARSGDCSLIDSISFGGRVSTNDVPQSVQELKPERYSDLQLGQNIFRRMYYIVELFALITKPI